MRLLSGNINNLTMIFFGLMLIVFIVLFVVYAILNNNNTQTLQDVVRTALVQNRDDAARVSGKSLYALNIQGFEDDVKTANLKEIKTHRIAGNKNSRFHFYYLLQNGDLVDTDTYQKKVADGTMSGDAHAGKTTLIKGVTVAVNIKNSEATNDKGKNEQKTNDGDTTRYAVTYLIDGGKVVNADSNHEAVRNTPDNYQGYVRNGSFDFSKTHDGKPANFDKDGHGHNTMLNVTDD